MFVTPVSNLSQYRALTLTLLCIIFKLKWNKNGSNNLVGTVKTLTLNNQENDISQTKFDVLYLHDENIPDVTIDLSDENLKPQTKLFSRIKTCLSQRLDLKLDFIIAWEPPEESMCPSSVAAYFHSKEYVVKLCCPKFSKKHAYNLTVPSLQLNDPVDIVDWLGAASHSAQSDEQSSFVSEFLNLFEGDTCGQLTVLNWNGFFTTQKIKQLFKILRLYVKKSDNIPWCSLHVQGFDDSPVTFSNQEHSFFVNGDNMYTIFTDRNQSCLVSTLTSSKTVRNKKK